MTSNSMSKMLDLEMKHSFTSRFFCAWFTVR